MGLKSASTGISGHTARPYHFSKSSSFTESQCEHNNHWYGHTRSYGVPVPASPPGRSVTSNEPNSGIGRARPFCPPVPSYNRHIHGLGGGDPKPNTPISLSSSSSKPQNTLFGCPPLLVFYSITHTQRSKVRFSSDPSLICIKTLLYLFSLSIYAYTCHELFFLMHMIIFAI
jgi:hypothetical protein